MRNLKIVRKLIPYFLILLIIFSIYMLCNYEGFSATMTCKCPGTSKIMIGTTNNNSSKCYDCGSGSIKSNGACSNNVIPVVSYKSCSCSNGKGQMCSGGATRMPNNTCYSCDPTPPNNKVTFMTSGTYKDTVRCTSDGSSTNPTSEAAIAASPGLVCSA